MSPSHSSSRRRRPNHARPGAEPLEARSLLSGGVGNTFALIPATIDKPGGSTTVSFTLDPKLFTLPKGRMVLGIDVAPRSGQHVEPLITAVTDPHSTIVPQAIHSIYNPHLSHAAVARGAGTSAVLAPVTLFPNQPNKPATYTVTVQAQERTSGSFLVGFYLPGDANGDGVVDQTDLQVVRSKLNSRNGDKRYDFDADVNRDGRIGRIDLAYTLQNQGVKTLVTPVVSAKLDPKSTDGLPKRVTSQSSVLFEGSGTPGARITFSELNHRVADASTVIGAGGNYLLAVPVADGSNTFSVTTADPFGQTISGRIAPVIRINPDAMKSLVVRATQVG